MSMDFLYLLPFSSKNVRSYLISYMCFSENRTVDAECQVDGDDFDHEKAVKELPNREGTGGELDKFDIKKATIGSLLLDLSASPDVLKNPETLKAAIKDLTERIIKAGNVDTSVPGKLNIKLIFRSPLTQGKQRKNANRTFRHIYRNID